MKNKLLKFKDKFQEEATVKGIDCALIIFDGDRICVTAHCDLIQLSGGIKALLKILAEGMNKEPIKERDVGVG